MESCQRRHQVRAHGQGKGAFSRKRHVGAGPKGGRSLPGTELGWEHRAQEGLPPQIQGRRGEKRHAQP